LYEAYLSISKFPDTAVDNAIEMLEDAGYVVDTTRLQSYKELLFSWI
jgi:biotin operon repressor